MNEPRWYYPDGRPCATVPNAKGNGERRPTVRDARALGLLPSVTTLLSVVRKPGLEAWMLRSNEAEAEERRESAAARGTMIHAGIQSRLADWPTVTADVLQTQDMRVSAWAEWFSKTPFMPQSSEKGLALPDERYAGTPDLVAIDRATEELVVLDWKTQATAGKDLKFWDEWPMQLAAYGHMVNPEEMPRLVSVLISIDEPVVISHEWNRDRYERYLRAFYCARDLWYSELGPGKSLSREGEDEDDE